ncbi:MAG: hypothetical protein M1820_002689 [Bogoriella megaspora]|nr:MAG: hypothetical protein M1820_002689 [Bogoriella megaspora]
MELKSEYATAICSETSRARCWEDDEPTRAATMALVALDLASSPAQSRKNSSTVGSAPADPSFSDPASAAPSSQLRSRDLVPQLLAILNSSGGIKLEEQELTDIYIRIIKQIAPDPANPTFDDLSKAKTPLARAFVEAKKAKSSEAGSATKALRSLSTSSLSSALSPTATQAGSALSTPYSASPLSLGAIQFRPPALPGLPAAEAEGDDIAIFQPSRPQQKLTMSVTPTLDKFLSEVSKVVSERNGEKLKDYLVIEPPYSALYNTMIGEFKQNCPIGSDKALEDKVTRGIPAAREVSEDVYWDAFIQFMVAYLRFICDVNIDNLLSTFERLSGLFQQVARSTSMFSHSNFQYRKATAALSHGSLGVMMLLTIVAYARVLCRLAIGLDNQPWLIAHLPQRVTEDGRRESLPERAANILRGAFTICLNDRLAAPGGVKDGKPDGRKVGIYKIANICLKTLFQCNKLGNVDTIITNISNASPPLSVYPTSERVTYLYYLGLHSYFHNHYYQAMLALGTAYQQCHRQAIKQRRMILLYLIVTNIILGRLPTDALYHRPEAHGFDEKFRPICTAIIKGDLYSFNNFLEDGGPFADWFIYFKIQLQIKSLARPLVWRSLARRVFLLCGQTPSEGSKAAPSLRIEDLHKACLLLEPQPESEPYIHPEFRARITPDEAISARFTDTSATEAEITSMISMGFMVGFISHVQSKFAILGARRLEAVVAGFPIPFKVFKARAVEDVVGWKK